MKASHLVAMVCIFALLPWLCAGVYYSVGISFVHAVKLAATILMILWTPMVFIAGIIFVECYKQTVHN